MEKSQLPNVDWDKVIGMLNQDLPGVILLNAQEEILLKELVQIKSASRDFIDEAVDTEQELAVLMNRLNFSDVAVPKVQKLWPRVAAAVAILLVVGAGLFYYGRIPQSRYANDVMPGKSGATLVLSSGKKIVLSSALNGDLAKESGVVISKKSDGQLTYEIKDQQSRETNQINTLSTARGETYQVKLPDGTSIWLNAGSVLKYPASFTGLKTRNIELSGEAYFEVAKDKLHPFFVVSGGQRVEVLGTHFNVSAYPDEQVIKTTLVEGSVKVFAGQMESLLKPNQQAAFNGDHLDVSDIDAEYALAWKNGFFLFNVESLESIMIKISRWYNVRVEYADPTLRSKTFVGTISRFEKVSKVLDMLQRTGSATFVVNGNKIIVDKKN